MDFPSTVRAYCKRVFQPTRGEMVPVAVRQAWKTMVTGRPGPVVLDVPFDVFKEASTAEPILPEDWNANISSRCGADPEGVAKAVDYYREYGVEETYTHLKSLEPTNEPLGR